MPGRMEASPFSWIQRHDLTKYNMNVDGSMYMDIDKYNGKYVFSMGRVGTYNSYIKFDNDSNILPCPQPDNEISFKYTTGRKILSLRSIWNPIYYTKLFMYRC